MVTCELPAAQEARLPEILANWPVLGCQVEDVAAEVVQVIVYLRPPEAAAVEGIAAELAGLGARNISSGTLAEADWLAEYRRQVAPRPLGRRFWIDPHPARPTSPPEPRIHLLVEPRQAFGTGSHESTALMLQLLEEIPLTGRAVLDVGTGSGILAMAAAALGAGPVIGFDIDLQAVCVASQTLREQISPLSVALFAGGVAALSAPGRFHVVLANLLPDQLQAILGELRQVLAPDGELVVSGLLAAQRTASEVELARVGLSVVGSLTMGEWVALRCRPEAVQA